MARSTRRLKLIFETQQVCYATVCILDRRDFEKLISPLRVSGNSWIEIFVSNAYTYACKLNYLIIFT